jgi:hypothetical protein
MLDSSFKFQISNFGFADKSSVHNRRQPRQRAADHLFIQRDRGPNPGEWIWKLPDG